MRKLVLIGKSLFFGLLALALPLAVPASAYAVSYSNPTNVTVYTAPQTPGVCKIIVTWDDVGADAYEEYFDGHLVFGGARPTAPDGNQSFVINGQGGVGFDFGAGQYWGPIPSSVTLYSYYNSLPGNYDTGVTLPIDQSCPNTAPAGSIDAKPVISPITAPTTPVLVGAPITVSASFTDAEAQDTHVAAWDWGGDGDFSPGIITESNGSGTVTGTHVYRDPGVYTIRLYLTDSVGASTTQTFEYVSVYNELPQGVFTAGRKFDSPAGAYTANPSLTSQVKFGVSAKYNNNGQLVGDVSMNFNDGTLTFVSTHVTWLTTSNGVATLRGTGTVNGTAGYAILVTGLSGQHGGDRTIRFQIKDPNGNVIYDTQPNAPDDATPTTTVGGQVIVR